MLCPVRYHKKFADLSETESIEMWISAKKIGESLKSLYGVEAIQYTIQDGIDAGQTVDHVHMHIIPIPKRKYNKDEDIDAPERVARNLEEWPKKLNYIGNRLILNRIDDNFFLFMHLLN